MNQHEDGTENVVCIKSKERWQSPGHALKLLVFGLTKAIETSGVEPVVKVGSLVPLVDGEAPVIADQELCDYLNGTA
jgi:hypothetical protein